MLKQQTQRQTNRRDFMKAFAAGGLALSTLGCSAFAQESKKKPNVVLIYTDDLGYGDVGCNGATKVRTPNIDKIAAQGRRFTNAHVASAACSPSRYGLLTGRYPWRANFWRPVFAPSPLQIDPNRKTLPDVMKASGYATACVGKWHLGFGEKPRIDWNGKLSPGPLDCGFDYYYGVPVVNSHPPFVYVENDRVLGLDPSDPIKYTRKGNVPSKAYPLKHTKGRFAGMTGGKAAHDLYVDEMVGTHLTEKATAWMGEQKNKPFFLYFATTNIHHPYTPHPRFKGTSDCGDYGDFIHELDWMVGEVMKTLEEMGELDNTLLIFTSDNGGMLNPVGKAAWEAGHKLNGDYLGFKFDVWEGGQRIPFLAQWPGHVPPNTTSDALICTTDLMATVAGMLGQKLGPDEGPDSVNILPALTGTPEKPLHDYLILMAAGRGRYGVRKGKWMYIPGQGGGGFGNGIHGLAKTDQKNSDVLDRGDRGAIKPGAPANQLYDLEKDPGQHTNVIEQFPEVAKELQAILDKELDAQPGLER